MTSTLCAAGSAGASEVLRVAPDGTAHRAQARLLPGPAASRLPTVPSGTRIVTPVRRARITTLTTAERPRYDAALAAARRQRDALAGAPRTELASVIATAKGIDARGELTSGRLNAVVSTLERNTQFWAVNPPPPAGTRVQFSGTPVTFQYYPGQGVQIQPLANFGTANAAWRTCRARADTACPKLRTLLDAMLSLASQRGSFTTWEYFFDFEGGVPPWTSAMSQGTGIQAFARGYRLTGDVRYRTVATAALGAFETPAPVGVLRPATGGSHYLMYSYAPDLFIFNGFLQALVGLDEYRDITGDPRGTTLFRNGHAHAKWLVPFSDTGSWSRYSLGGPESTLSYHTLLRDFLQELCGRIGTAVYCDTASRFTRYLATRTG